MNSKKAGLILTAAAVAYGIYRYTKMTEEERNNLKAKANDFLDKSMGSLGNLFGPAKTEAAAPHGSF